MSQQGPILVVSTAKQPSFAATIGIGRLFPVVETEWADAVRAVEQVQPAAVLAATSDTDATGLAELATRVAARQPYLPLISVDPRIPHPDNVIPFFQSQIPQTQVSQTQGGADRLQARLRAALRVRSLHATVMRRLVPSTPMALSHIDPARDATVLLIGRGGAYPTLSVALGERTGVVGALSIEAAAKHLNVRDIDGIVLGEGFSPRVIDAFLTVLTEDARFRNLPIVLTGGELAPAYELPNLEVVSADAAEVVATALPLIRQHAFEAHLSRTLKAID
ncbi:MAG: GGDEF domain-containing protein, partial [Tardiphaga sp.]